MKPSENSALLVEDIDDVVGQLDLLKLQELYQALREVLYFWPGWPTEENLERVATAVPWLRQVLDFGVLKLRLKSSTPQSEQPFLKLTNFAPEIGTIYLAAISAAESAKASAVERAEAWLRPIAKDAGASVAVEAASYLLSRKIVRPSSLGSIQDDWLHSLRQEVARTGAKNWSEAFEQARSSRLSPSETFDILLARNFSSRFFSFADAEEDLVEPALCRAVQWLEVQGFERWLDECADAGLLASPPGEVDARLAWSLFHYLRSDLIVARVSSPAAQAWLFAFASSGTSRNRPWELYGWGQDGRSSGDYFPSAAIFAFAWYRLGCADVGKDVAERALALLIGRQNPDGGWPLCTKDSNSSLLATCATVHALATCKPSGWERACAEAGKWLEGNQEPLGYWTIQGGPTIALTVLALDALSLISGDAASFGVVSLQNPEPGPDPIYDCTDQSWHSPELPEFSPRSSVVLGSLQTDLLIVVATEVELTQVLSHLAPLYQKRKPWSVSCDNNTYYVGRFGEHTAAVLRCTMGTTATAGATLATSEAIRVLRPRAVLMPGIAFGLDRVRHKPGDVLLARSIVPYESQRVGDGAPVLRGPRPEPNALLFDRLRAHGWSFKTPDGMHVRRHEGELLSGEKLVANASFREGLQQLYPAAIGGEMEGVGLAAACNRHRVAWVIAKSVCDWGDGAKHDGYQELAAASSVDLILWALGPKHALDGLTRPTPKSGPSG